MIYFAVPGLLDKHAWERRDGKWVYLGCVVGWDDGYVLILGGAAAGGQVDKRGVEMVVFLAEGWTPGEDGHATRERPKARPETVVTGAPCSTSSSASNLIASAADDVRRAREALRTCPPERSQRVEREATLRYYLDALLEKLPTVAPAPATIEGP